MQEPKKIFRIVVVEDSEFFNKMLTRQLENFTDVLAMDLGCHFEIQSYTSPGDCLRNLKDDVDIAFVDYYLGNGITGADILTKIKQRCRNCKVVIISQIKNIRTTALTLAQGAVEFIFKDNSALPRACFFVEDLVNSRLSFKEN